MSIAWQSAYPLVLLGLTLGSVAILVRLRAPRSRAVRPFFAWAMVNSIFNNHFLGGSEAQVYAFFLLASVQWWAPTFLLWAILTPEETAPKSWWPYLFAWAWLIPTTLSGIFTSTLLGMQFYMGTSAALGVIVNLFAPLIVLWNYRRASPIGRRQVKWVLLAFAVAALGVGAIFTAVAIDPTFFRFASFASLFLLSLPIGVAISVLRFNLFDVDRLISATTAYSVVLIGLVAAGLVSVPRLSALLSDTLGVEAASVQLVVSLALASIVVPAQRRARPWIDRWLFKERVALQQGCQELLQNLGSCNDPRQLWERTGERLGSLLRPDTCAIYSRSPQGYASVFVRGRAVPPAFRAQSAFVDLLESNAAPLPLDRWAGRRAPVLTDFDREALDTLGADVVIPVRRDEKLVAFVCLGTKRSGDVYTSTDLSLLAAVGDKVSSELARFDEAEVASQREAMHQAMRRYVPGAIKVRVERGEELRTEEQEISILFVDIRGYTSYSEGHRAEEIFSTVNRYTEAVSGVVQRRRGTIVEFNGDGMMAVFGAPDRIPNKEGAALEAGREIVTAVREAGLGDDEPLEVGVGIATGPAFVGDIQSVDRVIWSAIGNTTNLAARLQSLTRDLDASIVIDQITRDAVGPGSADFKEHADTRIRGRTEPQTIYSLPLLRGRDQVG
jgi:class 3 adenylate cyclase